ncbi:hypothetical protein [Gimesia maris]|uniref:hypothetical protein n=1 Tax=Gimesia maris TaxID=122 RepID=UPI000318407C|nr:hypothetical protein [Gimesia maris]
MPNNHAGNITRVSSQIPELNIFRVGSRLSWSEYFRVGHTTGPVYTSPEPAMVSPGDWFC